MAVRRDKNGRWRYRKMVRLPDGRKVRISGCPTINTKAEAEAEEHAHIQRVKDPAAAKKEVPTFEKWFNGRFWQEWVIGNQNKPSEAHAKRSIYENHLAPAFGRKRLDQIGVAEIARFRAALVQKKPRRSSSAETLGKKRINNILAVLSKALHYAADAGLIEHPPKVGLFKLERPEIEYWEFEEYARVLEAAQKEGPDWYVAVCLAGEAGLRVGEVRALKWREHVDLIAGTITVSTQMWYEMTGTPKGGRRRVVPITSTLLAALKSLEVVRTGYVVRGLDGKARSHGEMTHTVRRIYRRACLPERGWHSLRHSFGTHAALFGVNPWRLQAWLGHRRIDETMLYVHVAETHRRELPIALRTVPSQLDPDERIVYQLGQRAQVEWRGKNVANDPIAEAPRNEKGSDLREVGAQNLGAGEGT